MAEKILYQGEVGLESVHMQPYGWVDLELIVRHDSVGATIATTHSVEQVGIVALVRMTLSVVTTLNSTASTMRTWDGPKAP